MLFLLMMFVLNGVNINLLYLFFLFLRCPVLPVMGVDQLEDAGGVVHRLSPDDHHEHDYRYATTDCAVELPHILSPAQA